MTRALLALAALATIGAAPARDPEAVLARQLAGRTAGEPVRCILPEPRGQIVIVPRTALIFHVVGTTYVNRFAQACPVLDSNARITVTPLQGRLCENDMVRVGVQGGPERGICPLGRFVPYRKAAQAR